MSFGHGAETKFGESKRIEAELAPMENRSTDNKEWSAGSCHCSVPGKKRHR
jgi:hypothetical protein